MIRTLARPLLASAFAIDGVQMLTKTKEFTASAATAADTARKVLPANIVGFIPTDAATTVRAIAGAKLTGAVLLGTSKAPRLGALILSAIQAPTTLARATAPAGKDNATPGSTAKKDTQRTLITNLALLGGLAITGVDTAGKPGLTWRVKKAMPGRTEQQKMLQNVKEHTQGTAQGAIAGTKEAIEGTKKITRKAAKKAAKQAHKATKQAKKVQKEAKKQAQKLG